MRRLQKGKGNAPSLKHLKRELNITLASTEACMLRNLVEGMPDRLEDVIKAKAGPSN